MYTTHTDPEETKNEQLNEKPFLNDIQWPKDLTRWEKLITFLHIFVEIVTIH